MEDNTTRVIMIAVGLFIILIATSAIILYVSVARNMATVVDKKLNTWDDITVTNIMDYSGDVSIKCTGMDFVNFLRKNFMREDIYITVSSVTDMQNKHISWWKSENTNNISEIKLAKIDTNATITMKKSTTTDSNGVATHLITVNGNLFSSRDAYVTDSVWKMEKDSQGRYAYVTDGKITLEIGDSVNYVTSKSAGASWKVLGAENGKILLLGSGSAQVELNANKLRDNVVKLSDFDNNFSGWDNGDGALKESARCLNFRDIERLTEVSHDSSYMEHGTSYTMRWKNQSQILVNDEYVINLPTKALYWYNENTKMFEKKEYSDILPTLENNSYISSTSAGESVGNLTDKANNMLNKSIGVFLMNISTAFSQNNFYYTARIITNCKIKEIELLNMTNTITNNVNYYVRPVVALEQSVSLTKVGESSWSISK